MKKLHFDYSMQIAYSIDVSKCNFTIKCIPESNDRQTIKNTQIELSPPTKYHWGKDGLRNSQIYGINEGDHRDFYFRITGDAITGKADYEEYADDSIAMIFKHPHGLNIAGPEIRSYYNAIINKFDTDNLTNAIHLMHCLHRAYHYEACCTDVNTTAEEAFKLGRGVCQDYAHIFISLLHLAKIPARYVTGLILGEGASHAWVEILHDNKWYGLDPTNDTIVGDDHIKIGIGRDAHDCMINRGIMHGGGLHTQTIKVNVTEIEGDGP